MIGLSTLSTIVNRVLAVRQPVKGRDTRPAAHERAHLAALTHDTLAAVTHVSGPRITGTPSPSWLRRPGSRPSLPAEAMFRSNRAGWVLAVGLILGLSGACSKDKPGEQPMKCSTQTKCKAGYKCVNVNGGGPVTGPLDLGECEEDPCTVLVPCETPQPAMHPNEPCINDLVEMCDVHHPKKFCKCQSTLPNQGVVTTGSTPTTG